MLISLSRTASILAFLAVSGCMTVPPEVARTHQAELQIIRSLQSSHLAMADAYVDQKLAILEQFFFDEYGPVYKDNWKESFEELNGWVYDEASDFPLFYNDLVAEYLEVAEPLEAERERLKAAISAEYSNILLAHNAVGNWINTLERLSTSQRNLFDSILGSFGSGLSLESVEQALMEAQQDLLQRLGDLTQ